MKRCATPLVLGKCKLKLPRDTVTPISYTDAPQQQGYTQIDLL